MAVKLDHVIRCVTSRQICFPLLFLIASISLVVTSVQLSYVKPPRISFRLTAQRQSRDLKEDLVLDVRTPQSQEKQPNIDRGYNELVIEDGFHAIRVPFLQDGFKKRVKRKSKVVSSEPQLVMRKGAQFSDPGIGEVKTERNSQALFVKDVADGSDLKSKDADSNARVENSHDHISDVEITEQKSQIDTKRYANSNEVKNEVANTNEDAESAVDHNPHIQPQLKRQSSELHPQKNKGVIIVTNYRSGSTFLGQLFNQHPQAFYTFEPLYPFGSNCSFQVPKRVETLRNMLNCKFPSMKELYKDIGVDPRSNRVHSSCLINNFCFRYNHEHLCTEEVCPRGNRDSCLKCGPVDLPLVNNKCRSRKVSVIKVIKLCFVGSLERLFRDPSLDLKIIHLVRDPRGVASSRFKIHPEWDVAESILPTCQRQAANVRNGRNAPWLRNRYKLVRYEDLAVNPVELAKEIYDFVGLPFVDSVKNWIAENTQSHKNAETDIRAKRLGLGKREGYRAEKDPYSTQRDSTTAMQAWRKHLSYETVFKIQKGCFEALRSLGYKDYKTEQDLLNLNISAVL